VARRHRAAKSAPPRSPDERYEEFAKENRRWNEKIEEALDEMDKLVPEPAPPGEKGEPAPA
jgi:hypothetical protein